MRGPLVASKSTELTWNQAWIQIREVLCGEGGALSPEGAWPQSGGLVSSQAWGVVRWGKGCSLSVRGFLSHLWILSSSPLPRSSIFEILALAFFIRALLRYNLCTIKFTLLKYIIQWF